jgi:hypothetical protein
MILENKIVGYILIRNNLATNEAGVLFEKKGVPARDFFNTAYAALQINYPRFFKMDNLCKTGFLACEILLRQKDTSRPLSGFETGIVFSTANSSLDTDVLFQSSTLSVPSPSLFVYTLPNIVIGELCIRFGIKGESACFIFDTFNASFQVDYLNSLLDSGEIKTGICGWADFYDNKFEALFWLVEKTDSEAYVKHTAGNINKIYDR